MLHLSMQYDVYPKETKAMLMKNRTASEVESLIKILPSFGSHM